MTRRVQVDRLMHTDSSAQSPVITPPRRRRASWRHHYDVIIRLSLLQHERGAWDDTRVTDKIGLCLWGPCGSL